MEKRQIQVRISIEELRFTIAGLDSLKISYKKDLEEYGDVMEIDSINQLGNDIKLVESLHSDLIHTLEFETKL